MSKYTGTLQFTDIGVGAWHLVTDTTKYLLQVPSDTVYALLSEGKEVTVEATPVVEEVTNTMTAEHTLEVSDIE